jgi:hypothetical protein
MKTLEELTTVKLTLKGYKWGDDLKPKEGSVKPKLLTNFKTESGGDLYTCPTCNVGIFECEPHVVACGNDSGKNRCGVWFDWTGIEYKRRK